jgi:hypothetical protein
MNGPVDLLAVLRNAAAEGRYERDRMTGRKQAEEWSTEVDAAIAVVAELIEAVQPAVTEEGMTQDELDRLRDTLARVGGEA